MSRSPSKTSRLTAMTSGSSALRDSIFPSADFAARPAAQYAEYHSSADDTDFVSAPHLAHSLGTLLEVIDLIESDVKFLNLSPMGEPQLGKRGLLPAAGETAQLALLWVLNLSDGRTSVLDIAERSGLPFDVLRPAIESLLNCGLLEECRRPADRCERSARMHEP